MFAMEDEKIELTRSELESMMQANKMVGMLIGFAISFVSFASIELCLWFISIIL